MLDFTPTDEQRMIADTMAQVLADHGLPAPVSPDRATLWQAVAGLGMAGLPFAEAQGGAGLGVADMVCALIEGGRFGADLPMLSSALLPALCLRHAGADALPGDTVAALVAGRVTLGAAIDDAPLAPLCVRAAAGGVRLTGRKVACLGADMAAAHLVVGDAAVFLVPADVPGLTSAPCTLVDGRAAGELQFDDVVLPDRARIGDADLAALLRDAGSLALAADALGAMERINAMTLEHLKTRRQFGRPIGNFQVLQHRMVDMVHETEHLKSLVQLAAAECDTGRGDDGAKRRARAVSRLRRHIATRIRPAAASAIQLHGGIGMTEDYVLGALVKRVLVANMLFGTADDHAARLRRFLAAETAPADSALQGPKPEGY
ncbi:MAG: putative acyl-CoA dehydrogenase [Rhodobacteraceae bacterium HLUCCA12]|nr:MAG: putative acyl-CoA dehydrogenase [Rhodobacteraceae bacterium HLUCCA12]